MAISWVARSGAAHESRRIVVVLQPEEAFELVAEGERHVDRQREQDEQDDEEPNARGATGAHSLDTGVPACALRRVPALDRARVVQGHARRLVTTGRLRHSRAVYARPADQPQYLTGDGGCRARSA